MQRPAETPENNLLERLTLCNVNTQRRENLRNMICPDCAAENPALTQFCRHCGRVLEAIAVSGQESPIKSTMSPDERLLVIAQEWLKSQGDGLQLIFQGTALIGVGCLLALPLWLFSTQADWHTNWILVWLVLCGWLPVLGAIRAGTGFSKLLYSRSLRRTIDQLTSGHLSKSLDLAEQTSKLDVRHVASEQRRTNHTSLT